MTDTLQIILFVMLVVVIIFFLVLGVQVFFLLQEVRKTVTKTNKILDNTSELTSNVTGRLTSLTDLVGTVTTGTIAARVLKLFVGTVLKGDKKSEEDEDGA